VLLLVPAPIKRPYVSDLAPGRSVVRRALVAGLNVGLLEWTGPEGDAAGHGLDS
jgi:polyhydroxyalkanoate synthase